VPELLDRPSDLNAAFTGFGEAPRLFWDTEFESTKEGTTLCVVQVSDGARTVLVDALRAKLAPWRAALAAPGVEWVLHAGMQDVPLLLRSLELGAPPRIFDTQIAWALSGPEYSVSLAYAVYRELGVKTSKGHQADDWKRRPLPASQLAYAAEDVAHLPALRERLAARLDGRDRLDACFAASLDAAVPEREPPPPLTLASFRNAWQLDAAQQAGLRWLIGYLGQLDARERAEAPEPKLALALASRLPESREALGRIKGLSRRFIDRHGAAVSSGLLRASANSVDSDFVAIEPLPYATWPELRAKAWLDATRLRVCEVVDAAPELVLPMRALDRLREALLDGATAASLPGVLGGWRGELVREAWEAACRDAPYAG
jgi:ribonuclease D